MATNYFICSEVSMKCVECNKLYHLQIKDKVMINTFDVTCDCGGKCKEVNEYGN